MQIQAHTTYQYAANGMIASIANRLHPPQLTLQSLNILLAIQYGTFQLPHRTLVLGIILSTHRAPCCQSFLCICQSFPLIGQFLL